ncbi:MAG: o-succinylbenzoate synthase [Flavobacteriales bacterium]|nr:o-succinylbenzoate synthase [Flavobacteriales bacterium]|tara:strand:- start:13985 stop:15040 length:1056 start_codon:yes stop_codon:yes gene_type:complete
MFKAPLLLSNQLLKATWEKHELVFKRPAKTSREIFNTKDTYVLKISFEDEAIQGCGECSPLWTLSIDPKDEYTDKLDWVCSNINSWNEFLYSDELSNYPSIQFGIETALLDLQHGGKQIVFPSIFTEGKDEIEINGLIWMGDYKYMAQQIEEKIYAGFNCVKLKIGAIDWEQEKDLLKNIRSRFSKEEIELRVDANGAFLPQNAMEKLKVLADLEIHSIEQPIMAGQLEEMAQLCAKTPTPIALDEELIGVKKISDKRALLECIQPEYIILKPSLIGGVKSCNEWISLAEELNVGWWATSALEGNIGLNAIAQFAYQTGNKMPQGLGTGQLFETNFDAPIELKGNLVCFKK